MSSPTEYPAHDQYADADDTLDWDRAVHGFMADHATDVAGEPRTVSVETEV